MRLRGKQIYQRSYIKNLAKFFLVCYLNKHRFYRPARPILRPLLYISKLLLTCCYLPLKKAIIWKVNLGRPQKN